MNRSDEQDSVVSAPPTTNSLNTNGLPPRGLHPFDLATLTLHRWRLVLGFPVIAAIIAAAVSVALPASYTATTTFIPGDNSQSAIPAGLMGLAGQLGVSVGGGSSQSPQFYAELAESQHVLEQVLISPFADHRANAMPGDSATLLEILDVRGTDRLDSMYIGLRGLRNDIAVRTNPRTNTVRIDVRASDPVTCAAVANRIVAVIDAFNTDTRQTQAGAQRAFIEQRMLAAEEDLRHAEEDLRIFSERNRQWQQSPDLVFQQGWLQRRITISQEVYLTLARENENASIQEVNDTPVITVIDRATPPTRRSGPNRQLNVIIAFLFGGAVGVSLALGQDFLDRSRVSSRQEHERLVASWSHFRAELKSPLRNWRKSP